MFEALARFVTRRPRLVLAFWLVIIAACLPFAARVGDVLVSEPGYAPDSRAERVATTLRQRFGTAETNQVLLLATRSAGGEGVAATPAEVLERFHGLLDRVAELPGVEGLRDPRSDPLLPTFDRGDLVGVAVADLRNTETADAAGTLEAIDALIEAQGAEDEVLLTGGVAVDRELREIGERDTLRAELLGLPISVAVLVVVFGAVVAAALPLFVALATITASLAVLYFVGHLLPVASYGQIIVSMLGLATGIDYALLIVNRFREELAAGASPAEAAHTTTLTAGKAVVFSGLTVLVALSALLVPPLAFVRSMGIASIVVLLLSVGVAVTTLPALLTLIGHGVNRLRVTTKMPGMRSRNFWRRWARQVLRRPWFWTIGGTLLLAVCALPALRMEVAFAAERGLTADTDVRRAQDLLASAGLDSLLRSFDVLIDFGERGFYHPSSVLATVRLTRGASALPDVQQVLSPTTAGTLPSALVRQAYITPETAAASPIAELAATTVDREGRYALLRAYPRSTETPGQYRALEQALLQEATDLGLDVQIGGSYVADEEWGDTLYRDFPLAVGLVYLATFVLLGIAFHSLLIPLKSILLNTLTVGAAFGVITLVFQDGLLGGLFGLRGGLGFVETTVPIFIFAIVFGLSMDYEVFLLARVFEAHQRGSSDADAVTFALGSTGGVITSAATIMVVVFSMFLFSSLVFIKTLALGLTVAVLIDATLVRATLVPSMMVLLGEWNWKLPGFLRRLVGRFDLSHD